MAPTNAPWKAIEFAFVFAMWAVMMVGMMAPSAAPMILMYARVGRQGRAGGKPLAATGWFAAGYFLAWIGFSLLATLMQWAVERTALLDSRMASTSNLFGGIVLITAGIYQWTPLKDVCLAQCPVLDRPPGMGPPRVRLGRPRLVWLLPPSSSRPFQQCRSAVRHQ